MSQLATASALARLVLRGGEALASGREVAGYPLDVRFSGADLADGYFQFEFDEVAGYFCLAHRAKARDLEVATVYGDDLGQWACVGPDGQLWACAQVTPMGWAWSLFFCDSAPADIQVAAEMRGIGAEDRAVVDARFLRDRRPPPALQLGLPARAPCVDDAFLMRWN